MTATSIGYGSRRHKMTNACSGSAHRLGLTRRQRSSLTSLAAEPSVPTEVEARGVSAVRSQQGRSLVRSRQYFSWSDFLSVNLFLKDSTTNTLGYQLHLPVFATSTSIFARFPSKSFNHRKLKFPSSIFTISISSFCSIFIEMRLDRRSFAFSSPIS
jgi:hypothetical protein